MRKLLFFLLIPLLGISQTIQLEQARRIAVLAGAGGGGVTTEYQAVLDEATTQGYTLPSAGDQTIQNQIIADAKSDGYWDSLDVALYFKGSGDSDFKLINWKDPTGTKATVTENGNDLTWSSTGVLAAGGDWINTNYNPFIDATNWTLNSASIVAEVVTTLTADDEVVGSATQNNNYIKLGLRPSTLPNNSTSPLPPFVDWSTVTGVLQSTLYYNSPDVYGFLSLDGSSAYDAIEQSDQIFNADIGIFRVSNDTGDMELGFVLLGGNLKNYANDIATTW